MGKIFNKYSSGFFFFFIGKLTMLADADPPAPTPGSTTMSLDPPSPVGLPIDDGLLIMFLVALLFVFYKIF